ncbi:MAG TPA: amino acid permease [Tenuifilaceae bacterium]|nr:amino acid permease [Tenuifilaceae bacterium]HPE19527.1 amino acid permease [Tenuifilaceae bacterium]HPJ47123.1 amino acid permease [Tenuifilaceae bacterium]HPQ35815.1 amino acid permease [Tenuifilaceae bacterium]HRX68964.1 amino acid permease [Tenuifilaceae bacterium]
MAKRKGNKLSKELGLFDVFALSTGAMISSGFFLLPGLAANYTGPSVFVSYLLAAVIIIPAMLSIAELATAIPRSGGVYFLLDRSLGPMMGAIGGIGVYLSLVLKTAFALVGIGTYTALFFDFPVRVMAVVLTLLFMAINIFGAKKTSRLQNFLVFFLVAVLVLFLVQGFITISGLGLAETIKTQFTPFASFGIDGILATTGFVFVSYLGLTEPASVAEEVKNPEKNIPRGMFLSLIVTTLLYVGGVLIMVAVIPNADFLADRTPIWTAGHSIFKFYPRQIVEILLIGAAIAAFATTGNGGLMSASRYPMAMARDRVLPSFFKHVGKFKTPNYSIIATSLLMVAFILTLNVEVIAKMAGAFKFLIFILINFAVIVMRNSRIETYDPGFHSPLFPWIQIFGIVSSFIIIVYMGWIPILFSAGIVGMALLWYWNYSRKNAKREGAIYHWFALLGQKQHVGLENELLYILKEKGLREGDPFDEMIVQAQITNLLEKKISFKELVGWVSSEFALKYEGIDAKELRKEILKVTSIDPALVIPRVSILHGKVDALTHPMLHVVTSDVGIEKPVEKGEISSKDNIRVFFFLICPTENPKLQLRLLSRLMDIVERIDFIEQILTLTNEREIKEFLLHNERYITLELIRNTTTEHLIDKMMKEIRFPQDVLVAMVQRNEQIITPRGDTQLKEGDIITIIGEPKGVKQLFEKYIHVE